MVIKWVLGVFAFTIGLQHVVESAGICGTASIRPHWSDCRKFVECGAETTVAFQCPERSFFNPVTLVCDFAMYHECVVESNANIEYFRSRNYMEAKPGLLVMNGRCNELRLGAKFVNPDDCSQFFHCTHYGPMLFQCPANLLFNSRLNVCDWPQNVEDCSGSTPGLPPADDGCNSNCISDKRCPTGCHLDFIFLPHPGSCSSYLACEGGCACSRECDTGLYWSNRLQRCVASYQSECENPIPLPCPDCAVDQRCPLDDDKNNPVLLPLPDRDNGYLKCHRGKACVIECPVGMNFNQIKKQCELVNDQITPTTTTTPIIPTVPTTPPGCPNCPPGICTLDKRCPVGPCLGCNPVLLPHPPHCDRFFKCTHGYACEMVCPGGLHWSSTANRCDWPFLGDCAKGSWGK